MRTASRALFCALVAAAVLGCRGQPAAAPKVYTHEEFRREFLGATLGEVREKLGTPDEANAGEDTWTYRRRTKSARTGKVDDAAVLLHREGRVQWMTEWKD